jgi:phosphoribosylanthranilate isomerase
MTKIKICGMTREADVDAAVDLGVDALGFVLWDGSPRCATSSVATALVRRLPAFVTPVAVLVNPASEDVARAVNDVGCRVVQVHGDVDEQALANGPWHLVRAVSLGKHDEIEPKVDDRMDVLLDAHDRVRHGGTGRSIDWTKAAAVARRRRTILAGGLTPANVAQAVRTVRPYGVDVASGVEVHPGVKDYEAMQAFVQAVRSVTRT